MTIHEFVQLAVTDPLVIPGVLVYIGLWVCLVWCLHTWWLGGQL